MFDSSALARAGVNMSDSEVLAEYIPLFPESSGPVSLSMSLDLFLCSLSLQYLGLNRVVLTLLVSNTYNTALAAP